ncbi:MAG: DUF2341 domain-containing protein, partial [Methanosarcinales archaeon]|nr:DUF2341 domain-containing protein [Methanosarcinales archaeon]
MCKMGMVVLASVLAGLLLLAALLASASAGLAGWQYQRDITIQENSGEALHDYQVLVALDGCDFPGEAQPDGDDIRFTDADGRELSYWIEEFDAGSERAKIWVKVPLIPANGEAGITMWYGNPGAESESDGDAVFEFFDDFEGNDLDRSKWDLNRGDSHIYISNGVLTWHIVHGEHIDISTKSTFVMPFAVDYRWYLNPYSSTDFYYMSVYSGDNSYSSVGYAHWSRYESAFYTGSKNVPSRTSSWASTEGHIIPNPTVSRWYKSSFIVQSESLEEIRDGTKYSTTSYVGKSGRVGIFAAISRSAAKFDYVRVRSYASLEPTVTLVQPAPATHTALTITK